MSSTMRELLERMDRAETALISVTNETRAVIAALRACDSLPPEAKGGPQGYVTAAGLTRVPQFVLDHLGIPNGGGVVFLCEPDGTAKMLTNEQFFAIAFPKQTDPEK